MNGILTCGGVNIWAGCGASYHEWDAQQTWLSSATTEDLNSLGPRVYARAEDSEFGEHGYMLTSVGSIAVMDIKGKLVPGNDWYNKYLNRTGYGEIRDALDVIKESGDYTDTILNIASAGGSAVEVDQTALAIEQFDNEVMPVYAHSSSQMLSGAQWIGSAARKRYGTSMSSHGSVGVVAIHKEYTEAYKNAGVGLRVFRVGQLKALGNEYEKLTPEAISQIEREMGQINDFFVNALITNLGLSEQHVRDEIATGATWFGESAKRLGLINKVRTLDKLIESLLHKRQSAHSQTAYTQVEGMTLKKKGQEETKEPVEVNGAPLKPAVEQAAEGESAEVSGEAGGQAASEVVADPASLVTSLEAALTKSAGQTTQITQLESAAEASANSIKDLTNLVGQMSARYSSALGRQAISAEGKSIETFISEVRGVQDAFDARFPTGRKSTASEDVETSSVEATSMDVNRHDAVTFKK